MPISNTDGMAVMMLLKSYPWTWRLVWMIRSIYRIVGDDDGGQTFTEEEYDHYKKRVLPQVVFSAFHCFCSTDKQVQVQPELQTRSHQS